ncbi:hypothetical protein L3Q82_004143 [Scortum barcoo]|uniref:Uncharacterized protein n=1 Tax=Scortum barcoo TaxID=214431 RepID=A0ACB8X6Z6_9TELE|nr:hypothetical protein L3Q82_004143 [Scortum barcoo]
MNTAHLLPHTSKEVLPLRPGPAPNGTQPVNIVRPLRPAPSPHTGTRDLKVVRPPLPVGKPPAAPPKSPPTPQRLSPPKKPLPLNPTRSPLKNIKDRYVAFGLALHWGPTTLEPGLGLGLAGERLVAQGLCPHGTRPGLAQPEMATWARSFQ